MEFKHRWILVSITAFSSTLCGCAWTGRPSWFASKSPSTPASSTLASGTPAGAANGSGSATGALSSAGNTITSSFRKATSAVGSALSPVTPASWASKNNESSSNDAVRLSAPTPAINPHVYVTAGKLLEAKGDIDGAIRKHDEALKLDPKNMETLMSLAHLCDRQSRFDEAIRYYNQAIKSDPKYPTAHNDLGLCLARQGKYQEAHREISIAISMQPDNARYHNNLAVVCLELGDKAEALRHLSVANGAAVGNYNLGQLLYQRGQVQEAKNLFSNAVTLDPRLVPAQEMLLKANGVQQQANNTLTHVQNSAQQTRQSIAQQGQQIRANFQEQTRESYDDVQRQAQEAKQAFAQSSQQRVQEGRKVAERRVSRFAQAVDEAVRVPPIESQSTEDVEMDKDVDAPSTPNRSDPPVPGDYKP